MTGSILINKSGHIAIEQAQPNIWYDRHTDFTEVLVTGPLLLSGGNKINLPFTPLVINRHPRTVIGKRNNQRIIMVTIDGRTDQAAGMAITEVTDFMLSLRCTDAVNLDGGGSTTMWISGQPFNGVVNMPCDNKQFDHAGERAVSDILIIK
jgi:exopolysaccharide biosynthesis protein